MRKFKDIENDYLISEESLRDEFNQLKHENPDEYDYSFEQYIKNCTSRNGFLKEVTNLCVCERCLQAISSHEGKLYYNVLYVDYDDPIECDWCEEEFDNELFELI